MDNIKIDVQGDRQVGLRFEEFPDVLYSDLHQSINELTLELYARVRGAAPSDTGDLQSKVRVRIFTDKERITGYVDIAGQKGSQDFAKASALEYGAHRRTKVSAHKMRLDHHWDKKLAAPQLVIVKAYNRQANIAETAFERGSLEAMRPEILAKLNATVAKAAGKAST